MNLPKFRRSRLLSRLSLLSLGQTPSEHSKMLKGLAMTSNEPVKDPIPNGIHLEFKLSKEIHPKSSDQIDQSSSSILFQREKFFSIDVFLLFEVALFDVPKSQMNDGEDYQKQIRLLQQRCQRLLSEMKEKMFVFLCLQHGERNDDWCCSWHDLLDCQ